MTANINPKTGIAYGYISAQALKPEIVEDLLYGPQAENLSALAAEEDYRMENDLPPDADVSDLWIRYEDYEPQIAGVYEGVEYLSSWLGGALNFFISHSPHTTDAARRASPCVPNAGILDTLDGDVTSYDVPADWREE